MTKRELMLTLKSHLPGWKSHGIIFSFCSPEVTETLLEGLKWIWRLQLKNGHRVVHYCILPGWWTLRVPKKMAETGVLQCMHWHQWHNGTGSLGMLKKKWNTDGKEGSQKQWITHKKKIFNESKYISYWEDYFKISSDRGLRSWLILSRLVGIFGIHLSIMKQRWLFKLHMLSVLN